GRVMSRGRLDFASLHRVLASGAAVYPIGFAAAAIPASSLPARSTASEGRFGVICASAAAGRRKDRGSKAGRTNENERRKRMRIGVPKEVTPGERRVATTPEAVGQLVKLGFAVTVETGAGAEASFSDEAYRAAGAEIGPDAAAVWSSADIVLKVRAPIDDEVERMRPGQMLVAFLAPAQHPRPPEQLPH